MNCPKLNLLSFCSFFSWFLFSANRVGQPPRPLDGPRERPEKAKALLKVSDPGAGEGVPLQCLRLQAEAVGAGQKSESDGAPDQDLVPKPPDEIQEEHPKTAQWAGEPEGQRGSSRSRGCCCGSGGRQRARGCCGRWKRACSPVSAWLGHPSLQPQQSQQPHQQPPPQVTRVLSFDHIVDEKPD